MTGPAADSYTPDCGDTRFDVEAYDLELDYRVRTNRLAARAVLGAVAAVRSRTFALDLSGLRAPLRLSTTSSTGARSSLASSAVLPSSPVDSRPS